MFEVYKIKHNFYRSLKTPRLRCIIFKGASNLSPQSIIMCSAVEHKCIPVEEVETFVERCMRAVGTDQHHCKALAQVLCAADVRGHFTHGLHRLGN